MSRAKTQSVPIRGLIAEDSLTQAEKLKYLLEEQDYAVTAVTNGKQALEAARKHPPSLIISDIVMLRWTATRFARKSRPIKRCRTFPLSY